MSEQSERDFKSDILGDLVREQSERDFKSDILGDLLVGDVTGSRGFLMVGDFLGERE